MIINVALILTVHSSVNPVVLTVRRRGVNYSQPKPSAAFAFYDYLLTWGESVGETAVFSDVRWRHLLDLSCFPSR